MESLEIEPTKREAEEGGREQGREEGGKGGIREEKGSQCFWSQIGSYFHYILTCKIKSHEGTVSVLLIIISLELGAVPST